MDKIKNRAIKWHPKTNKICQIPKEGLEYALVSDDYEQVHQLVWCKDFMQDAIHGFLNKKLTQLYGFTYDPKSSPPISLKRTRLMVTNWKDPDFGDKITNRVLPLVHKIEDQLKMSHSVLERCSNAPPRYGRSGVWLLNSSKRWFKAPPMISFFTLLIRIGLVSNANDSLDNIIKKIKDGSTPSYFSSDTSQDKTQVKGAERGIRRILEFGDRRLFHTKAKDNYPPLCSTGGKYISIFTIHDGCGIVSYSNNTTKHIFPHWHRLEGKNK